MRVLVCGDRNWTDYETLYRVLDNLESSDDPYEPYISCIIEGDARGADRMAGEWAKSCNVRLLVFPAKWDEHGKVAGPIRNQQMLDEGKPDLVLAFHSDIGSSKGTWDMVKRANKAGIEVRVYG